MKPLDNEQFRELIKNSPVFSIDFILTDDDNNVLFGKRVNEPAKGYWFTPGGRVYKNEMHQMAIKRLLKEELNIIDYDTEQLQYNSLTDHIYSNNVFDDEFGTHYINYSYIMPVNKDLITQINNSAQHDDLIWIPRAKIINHPGIHKFSKILFT